MRLALLVSACCACWIGACASPPLPPHVVEIREGEEALAVGDAEDARERFERARELVPDDPAVLRGLALAEQELGNPGAALVWFDRLEEVDAARFDAELRHTRCETLRHAIDQELERESWSAALELVERAPAAAPCRAASSERAGELRELAIRAHLGEAARAREASDPESVAEHLDQVLEVAPGHADATLGRVDLLLESGSSDQAVRLLSEALAQHPKDPRLIERAVDLLVEP